MIFAQEVEHLLGLGCLREGGVRGSQSTTTISRRWLSRIFSSRCETIGSASCGARNRFGRPTRTQFLDLFRDPRFEAAV
jgi:hypothetical protein